MLNDSRKTLLDCHSRLRQFCQSQINLFINAASEYLFQQAEQTNDNAMQQRYFEAQQAIKTQHVELTKQFEKMLSARFAPLLAHTSTSELNDIATHKESSNSQTNIDGEDELSLLDNDEMELKIALASMSHRAEADYAEALFALGQRLALLNNGIKLKSENNPFAPKLFCDTFFNSINTLSLDVQNRLILLKLFERFFIKNLASIYAEINLYLVNNQVLPNLRYHHQSSRSISPKRRKSDNAAIKASENRQSELYTVMHSILNSRPVFANNQSAINENVTTASIGQLIAELSALQSQQLIRLNNTATTIEPTPEIPNTNIAQHQQAIDCVGVLFDHILNDNDLPDTVKSLLSHLHTPLLKLALLDETFLSNPKHDGRQLVNQLISAGAHWVTDDATTKNNVFRHMQAIVKKIITDFDHDNSNQIFTHLADEFNTYIEKIQRQTSVTEKRSIQAAQSKEALESGRKKVTTLIDKKLGAEPLPKPILQLINQPWSAFLSFVLIRHGEDSLQWQEAVDVIDNLLWYIEPKFNSEEIQQAANLRVELNEKLSDGLNCVGLNASEIQQHLNSLDMCAKLATENARELPEANHKDTAQQSTIKNCPPNIIAADSKKTPTPTIDTFKKPLTSVKKVSNEDGMDSAIADVLSLNFGTWLNWQKANEPSRRLKLTWYNKKTQNCMLSNAMGQQVMMIAASEIALGINQGWITVSNTELKKPVFERMLETVVEQLQLKTQSA